MYQKYIHRKEYSPKKASGKKDLPENFSDGAQ